MYDRNALIERLKREEGDKQFPYKDTKGKLTGGIGRNLSDVGLSPEERVYLCNNDIDRAEHDLDRNLVWWRLISPTRQSVLVDMCFNMGWGNGHTGLSSFTHTLEAIRLGDYTAASVGILNSQYHRDTGRRAEDNAYALVHDAFP